MYVCSHMLFVMCFFTSNLPLQTLSHLVQQEWIKQFKHFKQYKQKLTNFGGKSDGNIKDADGQV